jgi:hypothetical protein
MGVMLGTSISTCDSVPSGRAMGTVRGEVDPGDPELEPEPEDPVLGLLFGDETAGVSGRLLLPGPEPGAEVEVDVAPTAVSVNVTIGCPPPA